MDRQPIDTDGEVDGCPHNHVPNKRAFLAFWASFIGLIPIVLLGGLVENFKYESRDVFALAMVLISGLVWLAGLLIGILATSHRGDGRQPVRSGRAITAIIINAILLAAAVLVAFVQVNVLIEIRREKQMAMEREAGEVRAKVGEGDKYEAVMAYRISEDFQSRVNEVKADYEKSSVTFTNASLLDMSAVKSIEDIRSRIDIVREYLEASKNLKKVSLGMGELLEEEISKHKVSPKTRDEMLKSFEDTMSQMNPIILEIRNADIHRAETMLELVSVFEESWGRWKYNVDTQSVVFLDVALEEKYKVVLAKKDQADADLLALSEKAKRLKQGIR